MQEATAPQTRVRRHPIQGAFFGAVIGVAATIYVVLFAVRPFTYALVGQIVGATAAFGFLWGTLAPARKMKDMPSMNTSLTPVFTRSASAQNTESPTYEEVFGVPETSHAAFDEYDDEPGASGFFGAA